VAYKKDTKDLTTEEIKNIIDSVPQDTIIGFTGGEPTIRKDFIEILKYSKQTGHVSSLQTNGTKFADWDFALEVSKFLDSLLIAIHSHKADVHDSIVRRVGMYEKTIEGLKNIIKLNIPFTTQTVISSFNVKELVDTYDFIQFLKPGVRMNMTYPHPSGNAFINSDVVVQRYSEIKEPIQNVLKKYSTLLNVEAIPSCYLYPYHEEVFSFDKDLMLNSRSGIDPANKNVEFFDKNGITMNYSLSMLSEKRKGPRCKECVFDKECVGVWKEYSSIFKNKFDLFPIKDIPQSREALNAEQLFELKQEAEEAEENRKKLSEEKYSITKQWGALIISGNSKCMNRCIFCGGVSEDIEAGPKFDKIMREIDYFLKKGIKKIEISGADPGEYLGLEEVIRYLKENGIKEIALSTHGRTLKDDSFVKNLKEAGTDHIKIPLYGSTEEIHNRTVQYENSEGNAFEDTTQGIKNCAKYKIPVVGYTTLNQYNKKDINNIIKLYLELTDGLMDSMFVGIVFLAMLDYNYTRDWFLPIKDMEPFVKEIYKNHPVMPKSIPLKFLDIPYCVLEEYTPIIENKFAEFPNIGQHEIAEDLRSKIADNIPHYRIKEHFSECEKCLLKKKCGGMPSNELKMFGAYGLKALED